MKCRLINENFQIPNGNTLKEFIFLRFIFISTDIRGVSTIPPKPGKLSRIEWS